MPEDWRTALVAGHASLFAPAANEGVRPCGYPAVEGGWRDLLDRALARIADALRNEPAGSLRIVRIKEKFGGIRIYWEDYGIADTAAARVREAVDLAEARSFATCEVCGVPGRLRNDAGSFATRCDAHGRGRVVDRGEEVFRRFALGPDGQLRPLFRRRYDREHDAFVDIAEAASKAGNPSDDEEIAS